MIIHLDKEITTPYINELVRKILESPDKKLYLYINSEGGSLEDAQYFHGFLLTCNKEVITCVTGESSSAAVMISTAGSERWAIPTAVFLIHEARRYELPDELVALVPEKEGEETEIFAKDYDELIDVLTKAKASLEKHTNDYYKFVADHTHLTVNKIKKAVAAAPNHEWILTAKEALRLGFIDNVGTPQREP